MLVVSSKSGSTVETDSQARVSRRRSATLGIDPRERIVVVTDPGSPLDEAARADGYRVFNADPNVGGRYSALTAFGLVPSGLAGVDIARAARRGRGRRFSSSRSTPRQPGARPRRGDRRRRARPRTSSASSPTARTSSGFADWAEQLIAESTGKQGTGILPSCSSCRSRPSSPSSSPTCRSCASSTTQRVRTSASDHEGEILVSGSLGGAVLRLGVRHRDRGADARDQPVRPARRRDRPRGRPRPARRAVRSRRPPGVRRRTASRCAGPTGWLGGVADTVAGALDALLGAARPDDGYVAVQAYVDRLDDCRSSQASARPRSPATRPADHVRLGTAVPALDRAVPQGRPRRRRVPADHRARPTRPRDPRAGRSPSASSSRPRRPATRACSAEHGRPVADPEPDRPAGRRALALRSRPLGVRIR